ncbi:MAG TPA: PD-(D/E)XK nuclease family protein, partial [Labilithrix sp.]|nr:PD-(D/E)XK nuclease family protein [Labilithrix sp.]
APLDARAQGTIAHFVLEQLPIEAFLAPDRAEPTVTRLLENARIPVEHPQHAAIAGRAMRFLKTTYARAIAEAGATLAREVPFVLPVEDEAGHAVSLRGSMDLVVTWPDGAVDIVDYKSARSGETDSYAFQLDVYALAARERFPNTTRLRAGLAFLGGGSGEPLWRELPSAAAVRARIATLGNELFRARWTNAFPRVAIDRCESIHCGFIGRCHPRRDEA